MNYNPKIHGFSLLAKSILGRLERFRGGFTYQPNELLVLNYHSTPKKFIPEFKTQLEWLKDHFHIISPSELNDYYQGVLSSERCKLLLTFDDGLKNNLYAAEVLDKSKLSAYFFAVPAFIDTPVERQEEYYRQFIRPLINPAIDHNSEDFHAMTWEDLKNILRNGNLIGSHTYSHHLIAARSSAQETTKEIVESKNVLEQHLGVAVNSFCSINNSLESVGTKEKKMIVEHYRFHFTTLPGYNALKKDPLFIKRRNVECYWPFGAFQYALGKSDLKRWEEKIKRYENL